MPIRATGGSALLDMPDELDFGMSPVKFESPKTIMAASPGSPRAGNMGRTNNMGLQITADLDSKLRSGMSVKRPPSSC